MVMLCVSQRLSIHRVLVSTLYIWSILAFPSRWAKIAARGLLTPSPIHVAAKSTFRLDSHTRSTTEKTGVLRSDNAAAASSSPSSLFSSSSSLPVPELYTEEIRKFLGPESKASALLEHFHIQGWRWHTKSLVRDAGRLHRLALNSDVTNAETLKDATDYVVSFNLLGLHKIEETLFFPWMREKLTSVPKKELSSAFSSVMDKLENDRQTVDHLGSSISQNAILACDTNKPESYRSNAISEVAAQSAQLQDCARSMMYIEDRWLVPAIANIVPEREQKSFNNKVLLKLGLLDSRLHLVGMYDAIMEGDNDESMKEQELFQRAIPTISRQLIPRWKRKLYQPKTYMLE
jgi:hypothetical protein